MEITKWLPGLVCAASLAVCGAMSLRLAHGAARREALPQSTAIMTSEKLSCSAPAPSVSSDIDATVKRYYFDHMSEFAPLPASPMERTAAFRQIENQIRQKLGISQKS
ncbi:MAG TPA: hypothetical protein VKV04_10915 [Verrucomicrobiae bacterium]|nr:hypothetical protein [Verrucomicrobiae bacterium]